MVVHRVSDFWSNVPENFEVFAKAIGRSKRRKKVFDAVYTGKKKVKTVEEIMAGTNLSHKDVLTAGKVLVNNGLVEAVRPKGRIAYQKLDHIHHHKKAILDLAASKEKLAALPTKRRPAQSAAAKAPRVVTVRLVTRGLTAKQVTIDDVTSFSKVAKVSVDGYIPTTVSEATFRDGVKTILGEHGDFRDWGGEPNDLYTYLRLGGRRRPAAFAFKGPGMKGKLTPGKMGKNGDQIQRLFGAPAEVFFVQYHGQIEQSVLDQMQMLAFAKARMTNQPIYWGVINGTDSHRLFLGYSKQFNGATRRGSARASRRRKTRK